MRNTEIHSPLQTSCSAFYFSACWAIVHYRSLGLWKNFNRLHDEEAGPSHGWLEDEPQPKILKCEDNTEMGIAEE